MGILERLKSIGYEDCLEYDKDGPYFVYRFPDTDADGAWDYYTEVVTDLWEVGLELEAELLEHDCLSGDLVDLERERLQECVASIEEEKCGRRS